MTHLKLLGRGSRGLVRVVIWNGAEVLAMVLSPVLAQVPDINKDVNVIYFLWRRILQEWPRELPNQTLQRVFNMCVYDWVYFNREFSTKYLHLGSYPDSRYM